MTASYNGLSGSGEQQDDLAQHHVARLCLLRAQAQPLTSSMKHAECQEHVGRRTAKLSLQCQAPLLGTRPGWRMRSAAPLRTSPPGTHHAVPCAHARSLSGSYEQERQNHTVMPPTDSAFRSLHSASELCWGSALDRAVGGQCSTASLAYVLGLPGSTVPILRPRWLNAEEVRQGPGCDAPCCRIRWDPGTRMGIAKHWNSGVRGTTRINPGRTRSLCSWCPSSHAHRRPARRRENCAGSPDVICIAVQKCGTAVSDFARPTVCGTAASLVLPCFLRMYWIGTAGRWA